MLVDRISRVLYEKCSRRRRTYCCSLFAQKDLKTKLLFEHLYGPTHMRLPQIEPIRSARKAAFISDGNNISEMTKLKRIGHNGRLATMKLGRHAPKPRSCRTPV